MTYSSYDLGILQNIYEHLLWYNYSDGYEVIPWLAQNYTISPNNLQVNFTLRSGITFADGEPFNSTSVYFSVLRGFVIDGAYPIGYGEGPAWILEQLGNTSLSYVLSGVTQPYSSSWVNEVLGENFIQITGPLTFTMNLQHYDAAFPYLWTTWGSPIVAPNYTMQNDVALWNTNYKLPYPTLSGNLTNQITQYLDDEVATCGTGPTPSGCGYTYYDTSLKGSMGGTGPYYLQSYSPSTSDWVLKANPNYWGGPYQFMGGSKIIPQIKTIDINYVASETTRELDLQDAGKSGQAVISQVTNDNLYNVANRLDWLTNQTLVSILPGVSIYGPFTSPVTSFSSLDTNVTNPFTGLYYTFQPFADLRLRLALADSVNMTAIDISFNNNLGVVAPNIISPGMGPVGAQNLSITPAYSYNLTAAQDLLLAAMMHPLTSFTFFNGTAAPSGLFNNTFGCSTLNAQGQCSKPVPQLITLNFATGDAVTEALLETIAANINNISATYNMGLTVSVVPVPVGQLVTEASAGQLYCQGGNAISDDYPWVLDYTATMMPATGAYSSTDHYNFTTLNLDEALAVNYSHSDDITDLLSISWKMVAFTNQEVMWLIELYPENIVVMTSNIHGFYFNPSEAMGYSCFGLYFATMY